MIPIVGRMQRSGKMMDRRPIQNATIVLLFTVSVGSIDLLRRGMRLLSFVIRLPQNGHFLPGCSIVRPQSGHLYGCVIL